ncbi:DUF3667 domain-containing protein [Winogradskyella sp.]|jgi:hypothetical protein|uniref:DUF3667 domain-containing protein n=1 Tax=Winogradskyella sp. TaxID=1883156 RepID=UPI0025D9E18A|nr:DUF3667 domain-containing protein [Winogradskyella sp.]MCT4629286.1 DUF3667 domain-containing protein [Winogradskyella sp.]
MSANTNKDSCQNCEQPFDSGFKFCPHCGQKTNDELTIGVLFYNTISNYFSFDARFLKSFIPLMFKPGYLAKEFVKGKRLLYLHPAQMYLFVAVIFFFIFNFYVREGRAELDKNMERVLADRKERANVKDSISQDSIAIDNFVKPLKDNRVTIGLDEKDLKTLDSISNIKIPKNNIGSSFTFNEREMDSLIASGASDEEIYKHLGMEEDAGYFTRKFYAQGLKFYKSMGLGQIMQTFIDSIPLAMFFLLPIFAFLLKLFFFNKGRYAHHLVFSFYYFSFLFVVFSIIFGINRFWEIPDGIDWLIALSTFFYLLIAIIKFYKQNWFLSFIKSGVVSFLFLLFVLPLSFTILGFISFLFY